MKPKGNKILQKVYIETGIQKVLEVLFQRPECEFSLSDLAEEAGVAKANIGSMLDQLAEMDLIEVKKLSKIWRVKAKQESWGFRKAKIVRNLHVIYQSGLVDFLNDRYKNPKAIVLFGSFRRGEDLSTSDIDIAIEVDSGEYSVVGIRELSDIEKRIERKIQLHIFNRKQVDINVFNNIANGIVLSGFLEVNP